VNSESIRLALSIHYSLKIIAVSHLNINVEIINT
jgi:hypothetical protein